MRFQQVTDVGGSVALADNDVRVNFWPIAGKRDISDLPQHSRDRHRSGIDPRDRTFLGNFPLLFSHAECIRALREIEKARAVVDAR